jgi:hypothetical protein
MPVVPVALAVTVLPTLVPAAAAPLAGAVPVPYRAVKDMLVPEFSARLPVTSTSMRVLYFGVIVQLLTPQPIMVLLVAVVPRPVASTTALSSFIA